MSKTYRWDEVRYNKAKVTDRERMKRRGAAKICTQRDRLAEREKYCAKHFAFGALWALAVSKGKTNDWWAAKVEALYNREDCRLFDVMRRIGAVYIKFLPQRACRFAAVRYCQRHGVPIALLRIARQLHVVYAEGF